MCSTRKASMRACSVRTFSEYSNSMAGSSLERPTIVSYDLFIALPIEGSPSIVSGSRVGRGLHRPKQEDAALTTIVSKFKGHAGTNPAGCCVGENPLAELRHLSERPWKVAGPCPGTKCHGS